MRQTIDATTLTPSRMIRVATLALLLATPLDTLAQPSTSPATAPVAIDPATAALVAKLADADPSVRDAAQRDLLDAPIDGEALTAALRAARNDPAHRTDLDFKLRLDTLLVQAQERVDVGPTRITLDVKDAPLTQVLEEFTKQGKASFSDPTSSFGGPEDLPKVTLKLDKVTFWSAIKQLQTAANIAVYPQGGDNQWRIFRSGGGPQGIQGQESGAFLIQPTSSNYNRGVSFQSANGASNENFSLQFQIYAEPKIKLDAAQGVLTLDKAVDSNGNDLVGPQRNLSINVGSNGSNVISGHLQLKYPQKNPGERFAEVSGSIKVLMARRTETMSSDDLLNEANPLRVTTAEGVVITVQPKKEGDDAADAQNENNNANNNNGNGNRQLEMVATISGGDAAANERVSSTLQQARVTDERGTRMTISSFGQTRESPSQVELRMTFTAQDRRNRNRNNDAAARSDDADVNAKPKIRFQLDVPTSIRTLEIPFEMKDLKMP